LTLKLFFFSLNFYSLPPCHWRWGSRRFFSCPKDRSSWFGKFFS